MWKDLSMQQRADLMDIYLSHGISSLDEMKKHYDSKNQFVEGGNIFDGTTESSQQIKINRPSEYVTPGFTRYNPSYFEPDIIAEKWLPEVTVTGSKKVKKDLSSSPYIQPYSQIDKKDFISEKMDIIKEEALKQEHINSVIAKADARANRGRRMVEKHNNLANLQNALYNAGFYRGDRTFEQEVDGIYGDRTEEAIRNAINAGYIIDEDAGNIIAPKNSGSQNSQDSNYRGIQAIIDHKRRFNVQDPYAVLDKAKNTLFIMQGGKTLEKHEATSSLNKGDGWFPLAGHAGLPNMPRTTGAGVYTLYARPTSEYPRDREYKEPMFMLFSGKDNSTMAVHEPVNEERRALFSNGNPLDNRASYGCISVPEGIVRHLYDDKVLSTGDSIYVLPEVEGNYMYEKNGKIQMHYGDNNPKEFVTKSGFKGKFNYNTNK